MTLSQYDVLRGLDALRGAVLQCLAGGASTPATADGMLLSEAVGNHLVGATGGGPRTVR